MNNENSQITSYSLRNLIKIISLNFKFLFLTCFLSAVLALIFAISRDEIYSAEVLLSPAKSIKNSDSSTSRALGALVGVGADNSSDKTKLALKTIDTKEFFRVFYYHENFLQELSAAKGYDKNSKELILDETKYRNNSWVEGEKPNLQKAHREFMDIISVEHDRLDGFITIKVDHLSPYIAKEWLDLLVSELNLKFKVYQKREAEKSVNYLKKQMQNAKLAELKGIFSSMLVEQYEIIMLSEITDEVVFRVIDEPMVPDRKSKPSRAFITIFLTLSGVFLSLLLRFE